MATSTANGKQKPGTAIAARPWLMRDFNLAEGSHPKHPGVMARNAVRTDFRVRLTGISAPFAVRLENRAKPLISDHLVLFQKCPLAYFQSGNMIADSGKLIANLES
jgi:hypothetical protein